MQSCRSTSKLSQRQGVVDHKACCCWVCIDWIGCSPFRRPAKCIDDYYPILPNTTAYSTPIIYEQWVPRRNIHPIYSNLAQ